MTVTPVPVDPGNEAQLAAWDGDEGAYWAAHADRFDQAIAGHHEPFMAAAAIRLGEHVLDVGCGTGQTTLEAAARSETGDVLGVDLSAAMLEVARQRAAARGVANARFLKADAQIHPFAPGASDVAIARTAAMFFADQIAALANVRRALHAAGRIVLATWQPLEHNEWVRVIATALSPVGPPRLPPPGAGPFSLSDPDRLRDVLSGAGFTDIHVEGVHAPMWFGHDAGDATEFIVGLQGWMLEGLSADDRTRAVDALHDACAEHMGGDGVTFRSATWITTARAG